MTSQVLAREIERMAHTPGGVARFRRFILELAVHGKLVTQDPRDESAFDMLRRAPTPGVLQESQKPASLDTYEIPASWRWCRVSDVGRVVGGGTPRSEQPACFAAPGTAIAWFTPADLGTQKGEKRVSHGRRDLSQLGLDSCGATLMPAGTVLFTSRAPIGYVAIAANEVATNQGFKSIVPSAAVISDYVAIFFQAFARHIDANAPGTTFKEVSGKIVASLPFPLPPLAEQGRIVARVDELMALCDQLEAALDLLDARRGTLRKASLYRLTASGGDAPPRAEDVGFFLHRSARLITQPEHVTEIRQKILDLAVLGRLVPRDPASDTASRQQWRPLREVLDLVTDGDHATPHRIERQDDAVPLVTAKNVRNGRMDLSVTDWVAKATAMKSWQRCHPTSGDILMVSVGATIGRLCVLRDAKEMVLVRSVALLRPNDKALADFLALCLRSPILQSQIWRGVRATGQPCLYLGRIHELVVPLPPLHEQHRIVGKVDQLMSVCNELEDSLASVLRGKGRFMESLLLEALRDAATPLLSEVGAG